MAADSISPPKKEKILERVSKGYSTKFCNAIGMGISFDSALRLSIEENSKAEYNPSLWLDIARNGKQYINEIGSDEIIEKISENVINRCGYPIGLDGVEGIEIFKTVLEDKLKVNKN